MSWTQEKINSIYEEVQAKAVTDKAFRELVLVDVKGAVEQLSGEKLPDGFKIKVIESDPSYAATFVLPDLVSNEIDDEDLDKVAGGFSILVVGSAAAGACAGAVSIGPCGAYACAGDASK